MPARAPSTTSASLLDELLGQQNGVITRKQVLACGLPAAFVRRKLRRGTWVAVEPGVYITHTGALTWRQRAWIAVLALPRAALSHESALCAAGLELSMSGPIHVAVDREARVADRRGIVVHRCAGLEERVQWNMRPPRVRVEHAVLDVAAAARREIDTIAILADAVQARLTTPSRLQLALSGRRRLARRSLIGEVLADVAAGTCSVLEHAYLTRVERPHGLPRPRRQAPTTVGRPGFRDVEYHEFGQIIELDGRFGHDDPQSRDRDLERDLDAAVFGKQHTLRLGWGQVYVRPCATADKVAAVLRHRGWTGKPTRCPRCPPHLCGGL